MINWKSKNNGTGMWFLLCCYTKEKMQEHETNFICPAQGDVLQIFLTLCPVSLISQRPGFPGYCFSSIPSYHQAPAVVYGSESRAGELFNFTQPAQTETRERQKSIKMEDRRRMWMKAWIGKQTQAHSLFLDGGRRKSCKTAFHG